MTHSETIQTRGKQSFKIYKKSKALGPDNIVPIMVASRSDPSATAHLLNESFHKDTDHSTHTEA